jgi:hypothetical protein
VCGWWRFFRGKRLAAFIAEFAVFYICLPAPGTYDFNLEGLTAFPAKLGALAVFRLAFWALHSAPPE